jgi:predicted ester cyclase
MQAEQNRALIHRLIDAHNRQDAQAAAGCFALDATNHGHPVGRDGMARIYRSLYAAFPDFHWDLELMVTDGDRVAAQVLMTGTHLGVPKLPVLGGLLHQAEPTGRRVTVENIHLYYIQGGLIVDHHAVRDDLGMMQQLGLLPTTSHAAGDISRPSYLVPEERPHLAP